MSLSAAERRLHPKLKFTPDAARSRFELDAEDEFEKGIKANAKLLSAGEADQVLGQFGAQIAGFITGDALAEVLSDMVRCGATLATALELMFANGATGSQIVAMTEACQNSGHKVQIREDSWKARICPASSLRPS